MAAVHAMLMGGAGKAPAGSVTLSPYHSTFRVPNGITYLTYVLVGGSGGSGGVGVDGSGGRGGDTVLYKNGARAEGGEGGGNGLTSGAKGAGGASGGNGLGNRGQSGSGGVGVDGSGGGGWGGDPPGAGLSGHGFGQRGQDGTILRGGDGGQSLAGGWGGGGGSGASGRVTGGITVTSGETLYLKIGFGGAAGGDYIGTKGIDGIDGYITFSWLWINHKADVLGLILSGRI